jgi:hypothetical protein
MMGPGRSHGLASSPELPVVESGDTLEIESPMPVGKRLVFLLLALVPLYAPYDLLFRVRWTDFLNVPFLFAALISLGAVALSGFLVWAAVAGIQSQMRFDRDWGRFTHTAWAPVMGTRTATCPLDAIAALEVEKHDWSEGRPTYSLKVVTMNQRTFQTGSSWSREEVEALRQRVSAFLGWPVKS